VTRVRVGVPQKNANAVYYYMHIVAGPLITFLLSNSCYSSSIDHLSIIEEVWVIKSQRSKIG
jgi:hypothetical protein